MKKCNKCQKRLTKQNKYRSGCCKSCHCIYQKQWYARPGNNIKGIIYDKNRSKLLREAGHYLWIVKILRTYKTSYKKFNLTVPDNKQLKKLAMRLAKALSKRSVCPYTGLKLIPGTVSLDHRIPISKQPQLAYIYKNLQWVHRTYNIAKNNMTDSEYLNHCRNIVNRAK